LNRCNTFIYSVVFKQHSLVGPTSVAREASASTQGDLAANFETVDFQLGWRSDKKGCRPQKDIEKTRGSTGLFELQWGLEHIIC